MWLEMTARTRRIVIYQLSPRFFGFYPNNLTPPPPMCLGEAYRGQKKCLVPSPSQLSPIAPLLQTHPALSAPVPLHRLSIYSPPPGLGLAVPSSENSPGALEVLPLPLHLSPGTQDLPNPWCAADSLPVLSCFLEGKSRAWGPPSTCHLRVQEAEAEGMGV